ncbi:MAG TPA: ABC transporter ATP-binding protein [Casimicrobiaceae bacterium]|nr:ABC transporter ATP-binding protein [Casimicrobiaceae bacterium]
MSMADARDADVAILVERVSHVYAQRARRVRVLDGISLAIRRGEFVALVGPSGCGKTTLLDILSGLVPLQAGRAALAGKPPQAGRRDTARMFARDALLPWLSAYRNVEFAARTRRDRGEDGRERIYALLRDVGLEGFEETYPRQLSQGMRQRVALARTFSLQSEHIFLDEPFGALDAQTKLVLQDKLLSLWDRFRSAVVLVTHDLAEAVALSDRVIVMSARPGRIVADVAIDLPRPRSVRALQSLREYHEIYARLWQELERAAAGAANDNAA